MKKGSNFYVIKEDEEMNKIQELRNKRLEVWEKAKAFLEEKRDDKGIVSAENTATYEKMEQEVVDLGKEIDRLERQRDMDMKLNEATSRPVVTNPMQAKEDKTGRGSDAYKRDFWNLMRKKNAVITNALQVGTDSEGGYLAPDEFEQTLSFRHLPEIAKSLLLQQKARLAGWTKKPPSRNLILPSARSPSVPISWRLCSKSPRNF